MHSPIREQIKLMDRWQVRPVDDSTANVFVPGPWSTKRVVLMPGEGQHWPTARIGERELASSQAGEGLLVGDLLTAGQWNRVAAPSGAVAEARLVASSHLYITSLEAAAVAPDRIAIRVRLASDADSPKEPGSRGLLTLVFTLTAADGRQVGSLDVMLNQKARDLSVEMALPKPLTGTSRLKACLCADDCVIDNARIDVQA